jgi:hypothetical protein
MNRFERARYEAHEIVCDALIELNALERKIDADHEGWLHAEKEFAALKNDMAETRYHITGEYQRLLANIDASEAA